MATANNNWLAEHLAKVDRLASEIRALGFEPAVARCAASSLITYANAPGFGLDGLQDRLFASRVLEAIEGFQALQARAA